MALYNLISDDDFSRIKRLPSPAETEMYNALGRNAGASNDNFFTKRGKSIENALGTTGSAIVSGVNDMITNTNRERLDKDNKAKMNDIYKQFGFGGRDDYEKQLYAAEDAGNEAEVQRLLNLPGLNDALKGQANANANEMNKFAANYKDYAENDYISNKINQDRGKFAGSAINTLSTAVDLTGLGATPIANAVQGGIEGVADELEQNGLENFDAGRAAQNAAIGATTGFVTGKLNQGISKSLAKNGGNLFKGGNALTRGLNNLGSKTALGRAGSTLATGAARGAVSGAVGGATGAGLQSALNGVEFGQGVQNALQGAVQGAQQGAMTGGIMAGANMAISKTPGVGKFYNELQNARTNWDQSGRNFDERLTNTLTSGDSAVGDWLMNKRQSKVLGAAGNLGNRIQLADNYNSEQDLSKLVRKISERADKLDAIRKENDPFNYLPDKSWESDYDAFNDMVDNPQTRQIIDKLGLTTEPRNYQTAAAMAQVLREEGFIPNTESTPTTAKGWLKKAGERVVEDLNNKGVGLSIKKVDGDTTAGITSDPRVRQQLVANIEAQLAENPNARIGDTNFDADAIISEYSDRLTPEQYRNFNPTDAENALVQELQNLESARGFSQPKQNNNYQDNLNDYDNNERQFLAYGESDLGNRTRKGMIAGGLERLGNTLEGAQTNVTRAATKDLGIESAGKVVENVRKKTGLTNLETQAAFAKELTGGENSLMDSVQRMAITASEDGKGYRVDTTDIAKKVGNIVDDEIPLSLFGTQSAREKFISNLKRDITSYDGDVISNSNKLKAVASDLRGKGVVDPPALDKAKAKVYTRLAKEMDDLSYNAIPQENVEAMFDTTINEMRGRANQAQANGNNDVAKAYNTAANMLDAQPRTIPAFRSFKKDFVDVSKVNTLTQRADNGAAMQMGRGFGGGAKRFIGTLLQRPVNAGLAKIGGAINNVADRIENGTPTPAPEAPLAATTDSNYNPATQIYNAIGRTEGALNRDDARAAQYLSDVAQEGEVVPNTLEGLVAPSTANNASTSVYNSVYGTQATPGFNSLEEERQVYFFRPTGDEWTDMLSRAMRRAKNAEDYDSLGALFEMYQDAVAKNEKANSSSSEVKLTDKQRQANAAMRALEDMENTENNFGFDVSDTILDGLVNFRGNDYKSKAEALALQVGYMLSGATVNKEEAKKIGESYVPQPRESEAERRRKLAQLRGIISDYQQVSA